MIIALTKGYLCPSMSFDGKVHSVFTRSVNIVTDLKQTPWVSLLDVSLPETPTAFQCSLALSIDLTSRLNMGDSVFMRGGVIRFPSCSSLIINTLAATDWGKAPSFPQIDKEKIKKNVLMAETLLTDYISLNNKNYISSTSEYLNSLHIVTPNSIQVCPEQLISNIGNGKGLTPSGDDFLIGVLAVLSALHNTIPEADDIYHRLKVSMPYIIDKTTDISAHYLTLALSQHFSHPVQWLVYHLFYATDTNEIQAAVTTNLSIGSSSGADTIAGILYCINELLLR
ncbi:MAG: DUF2877 domain-containing protein [Photobacterium frigidiphilum]|uniref:DUF2877 domain-containing protein n=1 Tax=Photobacterium frigidiphilum TaxID=264736 RepID=UPI003002F946